ncbi:hypothetical protein Btus_0803 [Kyrpidia tusciae DSM 2912]|uniref:DUF4277 domain-containing protein n=1 Tax=Kyrpidia tusciae (strain DSM 2912 / NBRC 15312 / T2) TaxID=562970 RepID=D5WVE8_KYRT2|nr:hypothetical protein Btus_0803 [Kyrpidia tusciae DSM 2912]
MVNLLVRREPLYRIEWFFRDMDVGTLFGSGIEASHFNDYKGQIEVENLFRALKQPYFQEDIAQENHCQPTADARQLPINARRGHVENAMA